MSIRHLFCIDGFFNVLCVLNNDDKHWKNPMTKLVSRRDVTSTSHKTRDLFFRPTVSVTSVILLDITYSHASLHSWLISLLNFDSKRLFVCLFI